MSEVWADGGDRPDLLHQVQDPLLCETGAGGGTRGGSWTPPSLLLLFLLFLSELAEAIHHSSCGGCYRERVSVLKIYLNTT